jgi:hypothetical protein
VISETDATRVQERIYAALAECEQRLLSPIGDDEAKALAEAEKVLRMMQTDFAP